MPDKSQETLDSIVEESLPSGDDDAPEPPSTDDELDGITPVTELSEMPEDVQETMEKLRSDEERYCCPWCYASPTEFRWNPKTGVISCPKSALIPVDAEWYQNGEKAVSPHDDYNVGLGHQN